MQNECTKKIGQSLIIPPELEEDQERSHATAKDVQQHYTWVLSLHLASDTNLIAYTNKI